MIATRTALKLGEFAITEAGFGADLGAEKFVDIKCRKSGLRPDACVIVATIRALKFHGGVERTALNQEDLGALEKGFANLERHVRNVRDVFGLPCVVSINHFTEDTPAELKLLEDECATLGVPVVVARHWAEGGAGAEALAKKVVELAESGSANMQFVYEDDVPLASKIEAVAKRVYGAAGVTINSKARARLEELEQEGYGHFPVCIAKTQYSFSSDAGLRGAPEGHTLTVREFRLSAGAEFIVVICGDVMTMPGLPKVPAATGIDFDENGAIVGLF